MIRPTRRGLRWVLASVAVTVPVAVVVRLLADQGLERADQWSGVVQLFVALLGLAATAWTITAAARSAAAAPAVAPPPSAGAKGDHDDRDHYDIKVHGAADDWMVGPGPAPGQGCSDYQIEVRGVARRWTVGGRPTSHPT
jgi:hypothetical protein